MPPKPLSGEPIKPNTSIWSEAGRRYHRPEGSAFFNLKDPLSYDVAEDLKSTRVKATSGQTTQRAEIRREDAISKVPKFWQNALDITSPALNRGRTFCLRSLDISEEADPQSSLLFRGGIGRLVIALSY